MIWSKETKVARLEATQEQIYMSMIPHLEEVIRTSARVVEAMTRGDGLDREERDFIACAATHFVSSLMIYKFKLDGVD